MKSCRTIANEFVLFLIDYLVQFEKQIRGVFSHNLVIEDNIIEANERLMKCEEKLRVLDNMIELASQSLRTYFDKVIRS